MQETSFLVITVVSRRTLHPFTTFQFSFGFVHKKGMAHLFLFCLFSSGCFRFFPPFSPSLTTSHHVFTSGGETHRFVAFAFSFTLICAFRRQLFPFCCLRLCVSVCKGSVQEADSRGPISDLFCRFVHQSSPARLCVCFYIALRYH